MSFMQEFNNRASPNLSSPRFGAIIETEYDPYAACPWLTPIDLSLISDEDLNHWSRNSAANSKGDRFELIVAKITDLELAKKNTRRFDGIQRTSKKKVQIKVRASYHNGPVKVGGLHIDDQTEVDTYFIGVYDDNTGILTTIFIVSRDQMLSCIKTYATSGKNTREIALETIKKIAEIKISLQGERSQWNVIWLYEKPALIVF